MKYFMKILLPMGLIALLSTSCGSNGVESLSVPGGGGGSVSGGIGGTGISKGTVTGFGSVIVNGVTFKTDDTSFTVDDNPGKQEDLAIGMVVAVDVDEDGETAAQVTFEPEVEGPAGDIGTQNSTLTVLGRTIILDANTRIQDSSGNAVELITLEDNDMLEVSGLVFLDGRILATHIRYRDDIPFGPATIVELKGRVENLNASTFFIGTQQVDVGVDTNYSGITSDDLKNGLFVEVKGTLVGSVLKAAQIDKEAVFDPEDDLKVEIEGLVTATSPTGFSVSGQAVSTSAVTIFEDGSPLDIALNVRLEVEGKIADGVLVAEKVQFRGEQIEIEAAVDPGSIDADTQTFTVLGIPVRVNGATEMKDGLSVFSDISENDALEISGYLTGSGADRIVVATEIEGVEELEEVVLQAPVDAINNPELTLLEVTVKTENAVFQNRDGAPILSAVFFNQVQVGDLIKVKGSLSGTNIIVAEEVEFEG